MDIQNKCLLNPYIHMCFHFWVKNPLKKILNYYVSAVMNQSLRPGRCLCVQFFIYCVSFVQMVE